ncbi:hypothetical protein FVE85_4149 [Porphyridium purpureum]|uniref:Uncharacterized protein n=1 Tax=Porphyridium purpureum TaxID=35688 RepID=A0A5J4YTZ6_PORPP|nr:hypothetical protein FVE85_4149 [Porphyridium purpureum]|eukprot:POR8911..scf229_5
MELESKGGGHVVGVRGGALAAYGQKVVRALRYIHATLNELVYALRARVALRQLRVPLQVALRLRGLEVALAAGLGQAGLPRALVQTDPLCAEPARSQARLLQLMAMIDALHGEVVAFKRQRQTNLADLHVSARELELEHARTAAFREHVVVITSSIQAAMDRVAVRCSAHLATLRVATPGATLQAGMPHSGASRAAANARDSYELHEVMVAIDPERALRQALSDAALLSQEVTKSVETTRRSLQDLWTTAEQAPMRVTSSDSRAPAREPYHFVSGKLDQSRQTPRVEPEWLLRGHRADMGSSISFGAPPAKVASSVNSKDVPDGYQAQTHANSARHEALRKLTEDAEAEWNSASAVR